MLDFNKNIAVACGLGDLFTFLTRLDNFFQVNGDYSGINFLLWNPAPNLARELVNFSNYPITITDVGQMVNYLKISLPKDKLPLVEDKFITQSSGGEGVTRYIEFLSRFFPYVEQWIYLQTYNKYKSTFPFRLNIEHAVNPEPYFVVHPVSSAVSTKKGKRTWSKKRWREFIQFVAKYYIGKKLYIIGTGKDARDFRIGDFGGAVVDLRGKTSLTEAISLIYGASGVIGVNSWPTIISSWAEIPTYAQWFVQNQLIPTHIPGKPISMLTHLFIEKARTTNPTNLLTYHPDPNTAFTNVKKVFDAAITI